MQGWKTLHKTGQSGPQPTTEEITTGEDIPQNLANQPIGDKINPLINNQILRIYHQNIRGAKTYKKWDRWSDAMTWMQTNKIGIATLSETNTKWTHQNKDDATRIAKKATNTTAMAANSCEGDNNSDYQPGGTACLLFNQWAGRNIERIADKEGLGRWSGFKLRGKANKTIIILSAYRPTPSNDMGDRTAYSQQWRVLLERNEKNPDPRAKFITDLKTLIKQWETEGHEIIIGMDANDSANTKTSKIQQLLDRTSLVSMMELTNAPATYARGTSCIDYIIGTPNVKLSIKASGYLPFYQGAFESDHRALYIDLDMDQIFGTTQSTPTHSLRNLKSNNWIQATKFMNMLEHDKQITAIEKALDDLYKAPTWTEDQHKQFEEIDQQFTKLLIKYEKKCETKGDQPWSDTLHHAKLICKYWRIKAKGKTNRIATTTVLNDLLKKLPNPTMVWQGDPQRPTKNQLKRAQEIIRHINKNAWEHRQEFLIRLHHRYTILGETEKAKIVMRIQKAERKDHCFYVCKKINKPTSEEGGLTHILVQHPTTDTRIDDKDEMIATLHARNVIHFSQAKNTPCATGEISRLLTKTGIGTFTSNALKQEQLQQPTQMIQDIYEDMKRKRPTMSDYMPLQSMIQGFGKWRERTSTSPSGKHLGIYRTLTKAYKGSYNMRPDSKEKIELGKPTTIQTTALTALKIQNKIINLAISQCHSLERWKTIHNIFIEKIKGTPRIEKLRVIHIYEADWNLLLKYFIAYKLHGTACREKTVQEEQSGGRPGKCAAHSATTSVITTETVCLQKKIGATLYNDAAACFDRIIENISNATLMSEGLNPTIAKLHAQTLEKASYHIKTKYGVAETANGDMRPEPFYGTGQGAADSMPRWGILSDLIIRLYKKRAKSDRVKSPLSNTEILTIIKAYVDDTNSTMICKKIDDLIEMLEHNAKTWEELLYTIGGKLELTKCKFTVFKWDTDDIGTLTISKEKTIGSIQITDNETGKIESIQEIASDEPYKLLGVPMATKDAHIAQKQMIGEKCNKMTTMIKMINLYRPEMWTCLNSIALPTIKYGMAATTMKKTDLDHAQKKMTHTILPKLGYNRHTPLAVVYAATQLGGMGMESLNTEQGIAHIEYIVGGIREDQETAKTIRALLESYSIAAGMLGNPLEQDGPMPYIQSDWIDSTTTFLKQIGGKIIIPDLHTFNKVKIRDKAIMMSAMEYTNNIKNLKAINNCRIYLQVVTIAEITTLDGTEIIKAAYHGHHDPDGVSTLQNDTRSLAKWPTQPRPPNKAWRAWKKWMRTITKPKSRQLKNPFQRWISTEGNMVNRIWYTKNTNDPLFTNQNETCTNQRTRRSSREMQLKEVPTACTLEIICCGCHLGETKATHWEIWKDNTRIQGKSNTQACSRYQGPTRGHLEALIEATEWILEGHELHSSCPAPGSIHIWTDSKTVTKILRSRPGTVTITSAMQPEAELISQIRKIIDCFPETKIDTVAKKDIIQNVRLASMQTNTPQTHQIQNAVLKWKPKATLTIHGEPITANYKESIRTSATKLDYTNYLTKKYEWDTNTHLQVDWKALGYATSGNPKQQKKTTIRMTHGWLPTRGHPGYASPDTITDICPRCQTETETNNHFMECTEKRNEWESEFRQQAMANQHTKIHKALVNAIADVLHNSPVTVPIEYNQIATSQRELGWKQLLWGRYTTKWSDEYDRETNTSDGHKWIGNMILLVWAHIQKRWTDRCETASIENPITNNLNNIKLNNQIEQLYQLRQNLNEVYGKLLDKPIEERLNLPIQAKKTWYEMTKQLVTKGTKRLQKQIKTGNFAITKYFHPAAAASVESNRHTLLVVTEIQEAYEQRTTAPRKEKRSIPKKCRAENYDPP
jgi:hypothetical protein